MYHIEKESYENMIFQFPYMLYIASNSASRKALLQVSKIPFEVITQDADESKVNLQQPITDIVMQLAHLKMEHAQIPDGTFHNQIIFVVTADTLGQTYDGIVLAKPVDRAQAVDMLYKARAGTVTTTGFCLRKLQWDGKQWKILEEVLDYDQADIVFFVPDDCIDFYLDEIPYLQVSSAISIEGFGGQFLKSVHGNYETVVGLPLFKLCQNLHKFGFYKKNNQA